LSLKLTFCWKHCCYVMSNATIAPHIWAGAISLGREAAHEISKRSWTRFRGCGKLHEERTKLQTECSLDTIWQSVGAKFFLIRKRDWKQHILYSHEQRLQR
jgi:hypothetical protein